MSACSGAVTESLRQMLHTELQCNLLTLQLEKPTLQLLDRVLQPLKFVAMPICSSPCNREPLSDALINCEQLCVESFVLEANVI